MASVSLLIQSNPVKRNHHNFLLYRPPAAAAWKSRIELSRRIKQIPIKCSIRQHPPSSFSVDDGVQVVSENRILRAISFFGWSPEQLLDWKGSAVVFWSFTMYRRPMPPAASLVSIILLHLMIGLPTFIVLLAGEVPGMIHENTTSVIKLQVRMLGMGSSLVQNKLHQIAQIVDASTLKGLNNVSTELSMALLRHIDYCISGYSSVDVKLTSDEWKKRFELLSTEERGKLNVKNIWTLGSFDQCYNEDTLVTILVAVKGLHKLPHINRTTDLKEALLTIASIVAGDTLAVEVFWTPRNENDMQWEQKILKDFPLLRAL